MKLFSNPPAKRKAAVMVLLAWLFALVSGVAKACLLEPSATHAHAVAAPDGARVSAVMADHTGAVADHGDESPTAKAPCLKACDERSNALPTQPGKALADTEPAPLARTLWPVNAGDRVTLSPTGDPEPAASKVPLRVRYSRLAL